MGWLYMDDVYLSLSGMQFVHFAHFTDCIVYSLSFAGMRVGIQPALGATVRPAVEPYSLCQLYPQTLV